MARADELPTSVETLEECTGLDVLPDSYRVRDDVAIPDGYIVVRKGWLNTSAPPQPPREAEQAAAPLRALQEQNAAAMAAAIAVAEQAAAPLRGWQEQNAAAMAAAIAVAEQAAAPLRGWQEQNAAAMAAAIAVAEQAA